MGYFAVLDNYDSSFEVVRCHLNFWVVQRMNQSYRYYWDVGLFLHSNKIENDRNPTEICLALPFSCNNKSWYDLGPVLNQNEPIRTALFGERLETLAQESKNKVQYKSVSYENTPFYIIPVHKAEFAEEYCDATASICKISVNNHTRENHIQDFYIRLRFIVHWPKRIWRWIPSFLDRSGALFDVRIADCRETINKKWDEIIDNIVPIKSANVFLIAPGKLTLATNNPNLKYARVLESSVWINYIEDVRENKKYVAYHWCYQSARGKHDIDTVNPFRCFMSLAVRKQGVSFRNILQFIILSAIIFVVGLGLIGILELSRVVVFLENTYVNSSLPVMIAYSTALILFLLWLATGLLIIPAVINRIIMAIKYRDINRLIKI